MFGKLKMAYKATKLFVRNNDSNILTVGAIFLSGLAVVTAVRAKEPVQQTLKSCKERGCTKTETVKEVAKQVAVPAACLVGAWVCAFASNHLSKGKIATLTELAHGAMALKEATRAKAVEEFGEEKVKEVENKVFKEQVDKKFSEDKEPYIEKTGDGDVLFYDPYCERLFESDPMYIKKVLIDYNNDIMREMSGTMEELYYRLHLRPGIFARNHGWAVGDNYFQIELVENAIIAENGLPCRVFDFTCKPKPTLLF